jgi:hypothetical protein
MTDYIFVFVMVSILAVSLWGVFYKPAPPVKKKKYEGIKDLSAWHKNVGTRWNG